MNYREEREQSRRNTWAMIELMWEDDLTVPEIAQVLGTTSVAVNQKIYIMRKAGWPITYRRPAFAAIPERIGS